VLTPTGESAVLVADRGQASGDLTPKTGQALAVLAGIEVPTGISATVWLRACAEDGMAERTFYAARSGLVSQGLVVNVGSDKRPTYITAERLSGEDG
jgi:hypothetical protein